eukprot:1386633-Amorphochlora_amoeboformis.AAC.4
MGYVVGLIAVVGWLGCRVELKVGWGGRWMSGLPAFRGGFPLEFWFGGRFDSFVGYGRLAGWLGGSLGGNLFVSWAHKR